MTFKARKGGLTISHKGNFRVDQKLDTITILGTEKPSRVKLNGRQEKFEYVGDLQKLVLSGLSVDLNRPVEVSWL